MSWIDDPTYPDSPFCKSKNCLVPVINNPVKKRNVSRLFLLLGRWIACCRNTPLLRYFLKHNGINYPNATSDMKLYLTFLAICKQLCPGDKLFDPILTTNSSIHPSIVKNLIFSTAYIHACGLST